MRKFPFHPNSTLILMITLLTAQRLYTPQVPCFMDIAIYNFYRCFLCPPQDNRGCTPFEPL